MGMLGRTRCGILIRGELIAPMPGIQPEGGLVEMAQPMEIGEAVVGVGGSTHVTVILWAQLHRQIVQMLVIWSMIFAILTAQKVKRVKRSAILVHRSNHKM